MRNSHDCEATAAPAEPASTTAAAPRWQTLPLRALVPFEAAARLGSFHAAARELRLTPSAISHQLIGLEQSLGVALFTRVGRGIALTVRGARYATQIRRALAMLEAATLELCRDGSPDVVTIRTPPSLASKWLLPLLPGFRAAHPGIEVRLNAAPSRAGLSWATTDLAILYTAAAAHTVPLLEETIHPMCSPTALRGRPIHHDADLRRHVLIHTDDNAVTWQDWFAGRNLVDWGNHQRIQIDPSHVAIEAAARGLGVVLESDVLARDELASGRLVAPLLDRPVRRMSYSLAWEPGRSLGPSAALLRDWLVAAAPGCTPAPAAGPPGSTASATAGSTRRANRRRA
jgi:LysR family glycine cleavage system transcriptional activator